MEIKLTRELNPEGIIMALAILRDSGHYPKWITSDSEVLQIAGWWHVWRDGYRWIGYVASQDVGKDRWLFHFGNRSGLPSAAMLSVWRAFLKIAISRKVKLLAAYIPIEDAHIQRAAKIFKFRQINSELWVYRSQNYQK
jgi:hypothetical protein